MERRGYLAVRYAALIADVDPYRVLHAIRSGELASINDTPAEPLDGHLVQWDEFLEWLCGPPDENVQALMPADSIRPGT